MYIDRSLTRNFTVAQRVYSEFEAQKVILKTVTAGTAVKGAVTVKCNCQSMLCQRQFCYVWNSLRLNTCLTPCSIQTVPPLQHFASI